MGEVSGSCIRRPDDHSTSVSETVCSGYNGCQGSGRCIEHLRVDRPRAPALRLGTALLIIIAAFLENLKRDRSSSRSSRTHA